MMVGPNPLLPIYSGVKVLFFTLLLTLLQIGIQAQSFQTLFYGLVLICNNFCLFSDLTFQGLCGT